PALCRTRDQDILRANAPRRGQDHQICPLHHSLKSFSPGYFSRKKRTLAGWPRHAGLSSLLGIVEMPPALSAQQMLFAPLGAQVGNLPMVEPDSESVEGRVGSKLFKIARTNG